LVAVFEGKIIGKNVGVTIRYKTYDRKVVGLTPARVTLKRLLGLNHIGI